MVGTSILVCLAAVLLYGCGHCCYCNDFYYLSWNFGPTINISLESSTELTVRARRIDVYDCEDIKAYWEIVRAGGEVEVYTALSQEYDYRRDEEFQDRGLSLYARCRIRCQLYLTLNPTDLRYDGSNISLVFNFSECYSTPNITNSTTLRIQGLLEAPRGVTVETVGIETVNVSWSPPFTLDGVPILHYSVYFTTMGLTVQRNTTETHITLDRPCASTSYMISGWNEVGEGRNATLVFTMSQAAATIVDELSEPGVCLSCSFFPDSTADGCAFHLQRNELIFVFNTTRHNNMELVLLKCFPVPAVGEFSVRVYEIHHGEVQEPTGRQLDHVVIKNKTLIKAKVKTVSRGICGSCYIPNNSAIKGCTVELHNDENTFEFNMTHQSNNDLLLECFSVPQAGVFHVVVYEVQPEGSVVYHSLQLPVVTIIPIPDNELDPGSQTSTVTGLSVFLSLTLFALAFLILAMLIMLRRHFSKRARIIPPTAPKEQEPRVLAATTTTSLHENTELPPSTSDDGGDNAYEHVELKLVTEHEKIKLAANAAYGSVSR